MLKRHHPFSASSRRGNLRVCLNLALAILVLVLASAVLSAAENGTISAPQAQALAEKGKVTLIDVRSPQEWRQTGVPEEAKAVTIHNAKGLEGFVSAVLAEVGGDLGAPIATICARGQRSTLAQDALLKAGFTNVLNVREGMLGSAHGPGWLNRGLPLADCSSC